MKRALWFLGLLAACSSENKAEGPARERPAEPPAHVLPSAAEVSSSLSGLAFDALVELSFEHLLRRSPESLFELQLESKYPPDAVRLDDRSDAFAGETNAVVEVIRDAVMAVDRASLTAEQQLTYDVYLWYLEDQLSAYAWRDHAYLMSPIIAGEPAQTELFFTEIHPLETKADAEAYIARLWRVDDKLDQVAAVVEERASRGYAPPAVMVGWIRGRVQNAGLQGYVSTPYYLGLSRKVGGIDVSPSERVELLVSAQFAIETDVIPAYERLDAALARVERMAPAEVGVGALPDGAAYYAAALRHHTTTSSTAEQIHAQGLADLERIHEQMRDAFERLGYRRDAPLQELYGQLVTDGGVVPGDEILDEYTRIIEDAEGRLAEAFDLLPPTDVVVIGAPSGGFYIGPSLDGSRPGAFYATVGGSGEARFGMKTLAYHEALPGHHLQIGIMQDLDLPFFRRVTRHTAYTEGWALYAERLAAHLGWYAGDAYGDLGRLQYEAFRAARLVMDTGLHVMGWDFARASTFMQTNVGFPQGAADGQTARYISWPGQATAYAMGMNRILAARARAEARAGSAFDLKRFHNVVLTGASVPLDVLDARVDAAF